MGLFSMLDILIKEKTNCKVCNGIGRLSDGQICLDCAGTGNTGRYFILKREVEKYIRNPKNCPLQTKEAKEVIREFEETEK